MAKKPTTRKPSTKRQHSGERYLLTSFFTLIHSVLVRLQQCRNQRELVDASTDIQGMLTASAHELLKVLLTPIPYAELNDLEQALKQMYGFRDGYPYTPATAARKSRCLSEKEIVNLESRCLDSLPKSAANLLSTIRRQWLEKYPCASCGAKYGNVHQAGCVYVECPFCHEPLSNCFCAYKHLKIKWGGRTASEWRALRKQSKDYEKPFEPRNHARPLTTQEERQWAAIVLKKGCIPYGSEQQFQ